MDLNEHLEREGLRYPHREILHSQTLEHFYKVENLSLEITATNPPLIKFSLDCTKSNNRKKVVGMPFQNGRLEMVCTFEQFDSLRHNLIVMSIAKSQDQDVGDIPLSIIEQNKYGDDLTPDLINKEGDHIVVIEVKTTSLGESHLTDIGDAARLKYHQALNARAGGNVLIFFYDLVVCRSAVLTAYKISAGTVHHLLQLFRLAEIVQAKARSLGWRPKRDEGTDLIEDSLLHAIDEANDLSKIPAQAPAPNISREMLSAWNADPVDVNTGHKYRVAAYRAALAARRKRKKPVLPRTRKKAFRKKLLNIGEETRQELILESIRTSVRTGKPVIPVELTKEDVAVRDRDDLPSPFILPLLIRTAQPTLCSMTDITNTMSSDPYRNLFANAKQYGLTHPENFTEMDLDELLSRARSGILTEDIRKKRRRNYHRVKPAMTAKAQKIFNMQGVEAKKNKDPVVRDKKKNKKKGLHPDTNVDDIDEFVKGDHSLLWENTLFFRDPIEKAAGNLIKQARSFAETNLDVGKPFVDLFMRTNLGQSLSITDRIVEEVNESMTQPCGKGEYVFKRIDDEDIWIIVKSSGATKIVFFTIAFRTGVYTAHGAPFRKPVYKDDQITILEFVSLNRHKVSHFANSAEMGAMLLAMWCQLFDLNPVVFFSKTTLHHKAVQDHFVASLLFFLESKTQTSTHLQLIRYAYMESIKLFQPMDPLKIIDKFDSHIRSRLLLWAIHSIFDAFGAMQMNPPTPRKTELTINPLTIGEEEVKMLKKDPDHMRKTVSADHFAGLISWVTQKEIPRFEIALNCSYFGSLHNKDEADAVQSSFKMFEKIISQELLMRDVNPRYMGFDEPEDLKFKPHEFSQKYARYTGFLTRKYLEDKYGGQYESVFMQRLIQKAQQETADTLATLKASAVFIDDETYLSPETVNKRRKVLEAVMELLNDETIGNNPLTNIDTLLNTLEAQGGVRANLFRKPQVGGVREIFVLDIPSRLSILFLETCCRIICEDLPMEMLTKGDMKVVKTDAHFNNVTAQLNSIGGGHTLTATDSNDMTKWCQMFVMPMFAAVLKPVLPGPIFNIAVRILNCATNKKLELPRELLESFVRLPNQMSFLPTIRELKRQFLEEGTGLPTDHDLIDKGSARLKNKSNMMQGIFHYLSSLVHAAQMMAQRKNAKALMSLFKDKGLIDPECQLEFTAKVSSDDASMIRTLISPKVMTRGHYIFLDVQGLMVEHSYPFVTIRQSYEKSTPNTFSGIEEFNSIWLVNNTLEMPLIKFVYAAKTVKVISRMDARQINMADLRKQVCESGGTTSLAAVIQQCHARIHYTLLGATINHLFSHYAKIIEQVPHPMLGFFIFEPDPAVGVFGFDFAKCNLMLASRAARKAERYFITTEGMGVDENGAASVSISLHIGGAEKYRAFVEKLDVPEGWQDMITDLSMLYRPTRNAKEARIKMWKKALTPSSADSFSFQAASKMYAAAVYLINTDCLTIVRKGHLRKYKTSMIAYAEEVRDKIKNGPDLETGFLYTLHPSMQWYEAALQMIWSFNDSYLMRNPYPKAKRLIRLNAPKKAIRASVTLAECAKMVWFKYEPRSSRHEAWASWSIYQKLYPWLLDDPIKSLAHRLCPFETQVSLADFVVMQTHSNRTFRVLGPVKRNLPPMSTLNAIIARCYMSGFVLKKKMTRLTDGYLPYSKLVAKVILAQRMPGDRDDKRSTILKTFSDYGKLLPEDDTDAIEALHLMPRAEAGLAIMQEFLSTTTDNTEQIISMIRAAKRGVMGIFTQRQRYQDGQYRGKGRFQGTSDGVDFAVNINDGQVLSVECRDMYKFHLAARGVLSTIKDLGLQARTGRKRPAKRYIDLNTQRVSDQNTPFGVPITVNETLTMPDFTNIVLDFTVDDKGTMRLVSTDILADKRKITVFSFSVPQWRWTDLALEGDQPENTVMSHWMCFKTAPPKLLSDRIVQCRQWCRSYEMKKQGDRLRSWFCRTLKARYYYKKSIGMWEVPEDDPEERQLAHNVAAEMIESILDHDIDDNDDPFADEDPNEELTAEEQEMTDGLTKETEFDENDLKFIEDLSGYHRREPTADEEGFSSIESIHPLWDDFIKLFEDKFVYLKQVFLEPGSTNTRNDLNPLAWILLAEDVTNKPIRTTSGVQLGLFDNITDEDVEEVRGEAHRAQLKRANALKKSKMIKEHYRKERSSKVHKDRAMDTPALPDPDNEDLGPREEPQGSAVEDNDAKQADVADSAFLKFISEGAKQHAEEMIEPTVQTLTALLSTTDSRIALLRWGYKRNKIHAIMDDDRLTTTEKDTAYHILELESLQVITTDTEVEPDYLLELAKDYIASTTVD